MKHWILAGGAAALLAAANPPGTAQRDAGAVVYSGQCARCHGTNMQGLDVAPALRGSAFASAWSGRSLYELAHRIRTTMPQDTAGSLDAAQTAAVIAVILDANRLHAGAGDLPPAPADQKTIVIGP